MSNKLQIGSVSFEAFGDRLLIEEDQFKSGYECEACNGTGRSTLNSEIRCKECEGRGALLVIPEVSERRPTTGRIVSTGPACKFLSVGQSVLYSSYAGHTVDLMRAGIPIVMRIIHEPEILTVIEGHLELRSFRGKSEIAVNQG